MAKRKDPVNPFYVLLVIAGTAFAITACAYCVMTVRAVSPSASSAADSWGGKVMQFLDDYGMWLMLGEIVVLAIATIGAISTDRYWMKRASQKNLDS
jgi:hypothetical protein